MRRYAAVWVVLVVLVAVAVAYAAPKLAAPHIWDATHMGGDWTPWIIAKCEAVPGAVGYVFYRKVQLPDEHKWTKLPAVFRDYPAYFDDTPLDEQYPKGSRFSYQVRVKGANGHLGKWSDKLVVTSE